MLSWQPYPASYSQGYTTLGSASIGIDLGFSSLPRFYELPSSNLENLILTLASLSLQECRRPCLPLPPFRRRTPRSSSYRRHSSEAHHGVLAVLSWWFRTLMWVIWSLLVAQPYRAWYLFWYSWYLIGCVVTHQGPFEYCICVLFEWNLVVMHRNYCMENIYFNMLLLLF